MDVGERATGSESAIGIEMDREVSKGINDCCHCMQREVIAAALLALEQPAPTTGLGN